MQAYIYWVPQQEFEAVKTAFESMGIKIRASNLTPCETLRVRDGMAIYASPAVFSRMCTRQGSWYRESERNSQFLFLSTQRLGTDYDQFLDAQICDSDFQPGELPDAEQLEDIVASAAYQNSKPDAWELTTRTDAIMVKLFFTANRAWGWKDTLSKNWLTHRANHANFLTGTVTTSIDGDDVPYSVSENAGVCSSCVEFFNLINTDQRKLVRACPGAMTIGGASKDVFLDVNPIR